MNPLTCFLSVISIPKRYLMATRSSVCFSRVFLLGAPLIVSTVMISSCADLNAPLGGYPDPYGGGYNNPPYNSGNSGYYPNNNYPNSYNRNDDYYRQREWERERRERNRQDRDERYREQQQLDRERERLEAERRRLDQERAAHEAAERQQQQQQQQNQPVCPAGFSPSDRNCSADERKRGCKDLRGPTGVRCVHR